MSPYERPGVTDESVMMRWMKLELGKINRDLVTHRISLAELYSLDKPAAVTKSGEQYPFKKDVLQVLRERLPPGMHRRLKLPVHCYFDSNVTGSCLINDPVAIEALKVLGEISALRIAEEGRLWIGKPIMYEIMKKYPSVFQVVMS
jgi:uncharacterized protein (UPF0216 family)